ncbi:MAG TPA: excinuclease ABC subunit UvrB, partial [Candidatus Gracilibacteria bacterium]|nr:excinuclease ABC subunit UvrB [Candidatus Gracilibacteria bacterium]
YIEKETSINEEIEKYRHAATQSLLTRKDVIIVASVSAIYGLGDVNTYRQMAIELKVGERYTREVLMRHLVDLQFTRSLGEFKQGMFSVLGDILEIFPPSGDNILRLEFFGDELESIEEADGFTGEVYQKLASVSIFPASHNVTTKDRIELALPQIRADMEERYNFFMEQKQFAFAERIKMRTEYDMEMLHETGYCNGIENYLRYLNQSAPGSPPATLLNYFPEDMLMFIDESHITVPQVRGMFNGNLARKKNLIDYGFRLPSAYDNRPLHFTEFEKFMKQVVFVSATPQEYEFNFSQNQIAEQIIRPTGLLDPEIEVRDSSYQVDDILEQVLNRIELNERVLITTTTKKLAEKLAEYLTEHNIAAKYLHSEIDTFDRVEILRLLRLGSRQGGIDVVVGINLLREGLDLPEVSLIGVLDADKEGFLRSRDALIQIVGRAARNVHGKVIMYARKQSDGTLHITKAMQACMEETNRRRAIQHQYNLDHGLTPQPIIKEIKMLEGESSTIKLEQKTYEADKLPVHEINRMMKELNNQMDLAAKNWEFEKAADLRDQIEVLEKYLQSK